MIMIRWLQHLDDPNDLAVSLFILAYNGRWVGLHFSTKIFNYKLYDHPIKNKQWFWWRNTFQTDPAVWRGRGWVQSTKLRVKFRIRKNKTRIFKKLFPFLNFKNHLYLVTIYFNIKVSALGQVVPIFIYPWWAFCMDLHNF